MKALQLSRIQKDKRGVLGLETTKMVIIGLLTLAVIFIAAVLALASLRDAGIFTSGSSDYNASVNVINNITSGGQNFFKQIPTVFTLLGVVLIVLVIAIIIVAVSRFGGRGESL